MDVFILLDRSGSMAACWDEALSSINTYVDSLEPVTKKYCSECGHEIDSKSSNFASAYMPRVTIAAFDNHSGFNFDVLRESRPANFSPPISADEVSPRGSTPLLDAVGRILDMAEQVNSDRTVIVVMTDGYENSSVKNTKEKIRKRIQGAQERGWQVLFIGADFDAFGDSSMVGVGYGQTISVSACNLMPSMEVIGGYTQCYFSSGAYISFNQNDRENLGDFTTSVPPK